MELKEAQRNENTAQVRMRLCKALKRARTGKEMSQMVLSEKSGVARSNIARIEGGNLNTGLDTIIKLCEALECSLEVIPRKQDHHTTKGVAQNATPFFVEQNKGYPQNMHTAYIVNFVDFVRFSLIYKNFALNLR